MDLMASVKIAFTEHTISGRNLPTKISHFNLDVMAFTVHRIYINSTTVLLKYIFKEIVIDA